ncbi:hypothetical protein KL953_34150 [Mycolicibacterium goodii]|uniref:hypothetical protein n=1 Tax=Mycolicibacterium goodii TaxID=134601 RepID=UPI001BDCFF10|nr:hypothetical protein [Mycolicibacterium goodii]MBU8813909.1 hypothetical protein [Mycolicibacterium goodii]
MVEIVVSPLVELVDLAARRHWTLGSESGGGLMWTRGGDEVIARFAKTSQRVTWCQLTRLYYPGACDQCLSEQLGDGRPKEELMSECSGGGSGDEGLRMLRHWLGGVLRGFGEVERGLWWCPDHS